MRLADRQRLFAAHLRDPEHVPAPEGIEPRRMDVYRELFFNNVAELLAGTFPVARAILGDGRWRRLVRAFYAGHHAHTPYFLELPREFVEWLQARDARPADEPPFLDELAHYEWVELALAVSDAAPAGGEVDPDGDLLAGRPVVSALAWPLAYRWPVHRLSPEFQPAEPPAGPTFLVVYREASGEVRFLEVTALAAAVLELLEQQPALSGEQALAQAVAGLPEAPREAAGQAGREMLAELRARGVLLGTRR